MSGDDETRSLAERRVEVDAPAWAESLRVVDPAEYLIEREIGRGGMGRVLAALDVRHGRPVALKLLHDRSPAALRRFVKEATLTARLQHPAIVPVYEAGRFPSGEPFYAMKRVEGRSLAAALAALGERGGRGERLALVPSLATVAEAVAYAHSQHVIHRDLKPGNILLGRFGEVLVVDWGLAKNLDDDEGGGAALGPGDGDDEGTLAGTVVGTPRYMAPEQARGETASPATDVYALGSILYHLLAGRAPFQGASADETLARLRAGAPPPLRELAADVPADLEAIVGKAMARAPGDRYASAADLAADLHRYTTGQLVGARRYSPATRAARWLRRHSRPVLAATATLLGAVALYGVLRTPRSPSACQGAGELVAAVWDAPRRQAVARAFLASGRPYAADSLAGAERQLDAYVARYAGLRRRSCLATARGEQSEPLLDAHIGCLDRRLARAGKLVALLEHADGELVERAVTAAGSLEDLDGCLRGDQPSPPVAAPLRRRVEEARGSLDGAVALRMAGRPADARAAGVAILARAQGLGFPPLLAESAFWLALLDNELGDLRAADAYLIAGLPAAAAARDDVLLARLLVLRLWNLIAQARLDDADLLAPVAEAAAARVDDAGTTARYWQARAGLASRRGDFDRAREAAERALALVGSADPMTADLLTTVAVNLRRLGRLDEAERANRRVVELYRQTLGPRHPKVGGAQLNLAAVLFDRGRLAESERLFLEVRDLWAASLGPDHAWMGKLWNNLGEVQLLRGRLDEARASLERAVAIKTQVAGPDHPDTAQSLASLALALEELGRLPEAVAAARRAREARERRLGSAHPDVAASLEIEARVLVDAGEARAARAAAEQALALRRKLHGADSPRDAGALQALAAVARLEGQQAQAVTLLRESLRLVSAGGAAPLEVADAQAALGEALVDAGQRDEGAPLLEQAAATYEQREALARAARARARLGRP